MMKCTVFIATSVDGFIAREDGAIDWLPQEQNEVTGEMFAEFMKSVDALVMGRVTYETVLSFGDIPWPYEGTPVYVLSTRGDLPIPNRLSGKVECMNADPAAVVQLLSARGAKHVYVDGGRTIRRFMEAGLVDTFCLTRVPVLLGAGIPLFGPRTGSRAESDVTLRVAAAPLLLPNGLEHSVYEVVKT